MASLKDFEHLLATLSPGDKAQILKWLVPRASAFPGIDSRPTVAGGRPCIVRTRIAVWLLDPARRLGDREQQLLEADRSLRAEELVNGWAYARAHPSEIEAQIRKNEAAEWPASTRTKTELRGLGHDVLTLLCRPGKRRGSRRRGSGFRRRSPPKKPRNCVTRGNRPERHVNSTHRKE